MSLQYASDQRVRVWEVKGKGNYSEIQFSSGRKDKRDGSYKNSPRSFVRLVWKAHEKANQLASLVEQAGGKGVTIVLSNASESNEPYRDKDDKPAYPKSPQITIFDFEFFENEGSGSQEKAPELPPEDDIPF